MAIFSFNGRVNIAVRIVTEQYPQAVLYEADGTASGGPTTDPAKIDRMRVVFRNVNNTTVIIKETAYGEFGPRNSYRNHGLKMLRSNGLSRWIFRKLMN